MHIWEKQNHGGSSETHGGALGSGGGQQAEHRISRDVKTLDGSMMVVHVFCI